MSELELFLIGYKGKNLFELTLNIEHFYQIRQIFKFCTFIEMLRL